MRVLSLFSGIGGFDLGLERAGMEVIAQVEIDPYCRTVLERHWPDVARYEDVRSVGHTELLSEGGADRDASGSDGQGRLRLHGLHGIDLICGGFPCQDVSVAGKRAGLDGERSGLWFEFQRILLELRPRWALIENVPGLLSSNQGRDFATILDGLGECGFGGIAWAVLDSQHWGVAQRRRRVFIVCGPTARSAEQVLSLCESCGGHPAAGRAAGEDVAGEIKDGVAKPLGSGFRLDLDGDTYIPAVVGALSDGAHMGGGLNGQDAYTGRIISVRTAQTSANGHGISEDVAHTIDGANGQAVAMRMGGDYADPYLSLDDKAHLAANPMSDRQMSVYDGSAAVRRLTPTECERLQGFPDSWTHGADGPRYRALGNAVTVPVIEYLGRRIMEIENPWRRVVFNTEVQDGVCPSCNGDAIECPCPGPTMEGYVYEERDGVLWGRKVHDGQSQSSIPSRFTTQPSSVTFPHRLHHAGPVSGVEDDGVE